MKSPNSKEVVKYDMTGRQGEPQEPVLHLYPLADEHGDALISGNREGLRILRDRIEAALSATRGHSYYMDHGYTDNPGEAIFAADGEQYHLGIECGPFGPHLDFGAFSGC
jgi:hypothetical protein